MAETRPSLRAIFNEASEIAPGKARQAYLDQACRGNAALRANVEELLRIEESVGGFLADRKDNATIQTAPVTEGEGDRIGPYKLLENVGEGGCGVVFVAQQTEPVRRRVAVKVIKLGMDTKQVVARFEAERQALAMMDHPNIAKVLDAGATENGRPYFVMELVRGIKITDYCDQANFTTKERIELFIKVCHAIQHAHQKGIIHRDIKPSNILVTLHDGVPVPKVIDFGIAKATEGRLTDVTVYTQLHQFIGTPAYMSPEQAEMSGLDIDTRSDIYSLGVLLYELLAGSTPFDPQELISRGIDAMRKTIREQEPPPPSTRFATLRGNELTTTAKRRSSDKSKLMHQLKGDLDWIVMKCLEKDRTRRYDTANGLAADLQRHLGNEPVVARPPSTIYRTQKLIRRNKLAFAAGAAIALMLVLGIAASLWQAARANREARRAVAAEAMAKQQLSESEASRARALAAEQQAVAKAAAERVAREKSEAISTFMTEVFQSPDPTRDGRTITVVETLDRAAEKLKADFGDQPDRRATLQAALASTYSSLGLYREAIPLQERVRDYFLETFGLEDPNTLVAMGGLADSYSGSGRKDEALKLREEVLTLERKVQGPEYPDTLVAMANLANSYADAYRKDEALKLREEVLTRERKANGPEHPDTLVAMGNLAGSYDDAGRKDEALKLREEVLTLDRKLQGAEHPLTLVAMGNLAVSYDEAGRKDEALKLREEVLVLQRKAHEEEIAKPSASDRALATLRQAVAADPADMENAKKLAMDYLWLGQTNEHEALCRKLLEMAANSKDPTSHDRAAKAYLIQAHPDPETLKEAVASGRQALQLAPTNHKYRVWFLVTAGMAELRDGNPAEAESLLDEAIKIPYDNPNLPDLELAYRSLARAHLGRTNEARADLADLENRVPEFPAPREPAAIFLEPDFLAVCLAHEEVKALIPPVSRNEVLALRRKAHEEEIAKSTVLDRVLAALRQTVDTNPADTAKAKELATDYLWLGQTNEHQTICRKLLELAANSKDPVQHDRAAKAYLIQSHPDPEMLKEAVAFGRQALQLAGTNDASRTWYIVTAGMAELRDGKPAEAELLLNEAIKLTGNDPSIRSLELSYRSLARAHLGRTKEARADLADLEKLVPEFPAPLAPTAIFLDTDFLAGCLAHEEAKALLNSAPPVSKP